MKTMEEFYKEMAGSKELQKELKNTYEEMLKTFLKKHDCNASVKDFLAYVEAQKEGEIRDGDAQAVAGGIPLFSQYHPQISILKYFEKKS
ncbi:MAG: hypothetical protein IK057_04685 [Clostridia bacterium]|nr:hypothetical protein [Clostridia bacterium]